MGAEQERQFELFLDPIDGILKLRHNNKDNFNPIWVDWYSLWSSFKKEKGQSKHPLYRALGLKKNRAQTESVWDATCGLGKDSLRMLSYGLKVSAIERSHEVFLLLEDGVKRFQGTNNANNTIDIRDRFSLVEGEAKDWFGRWENRPDVIYLDPMYEENSKRTALSGKEMRILHQVVGHDADAKELLKLALQYAKKRVVVKRSLGAPPLMQTNLVYRGSSTRYDVYLVSGKENHTSCRRGGEEMAQKVYDVYGLGNALVDIEVRVEESFLKQVGATKGIMTLIDEQRHFELLLELGVSNFKRSCGGSAANTVLAIAQMGGQSFYSCRVANDDFGHFFIEDLLRVGVGCRQTYHPVGDTGKCLVFVTPDADRTLNTYLGITQTFGVDDIIEDELRRSEYIYIEGYLLASPLGHAAAMLAKNLAKKHGVKIAMTFSDPFIVDAFRHRLREVLEGGVDLVFCNHDEALSYAKTSDVEEALKELKKISHNGVITLGKDGARLFQGTSNYSVSGTPVKAVDTNGAGDMFAGAFLYGITHGQDYPTAGRLASLAAGAVVSQYGPRLPLHTLQDCLKQCSK